MKYSDELIKEVKELYPNSSDMIKHAENGNTVLGRYLDDSSSGNISIDTILKATSLDDLKEVANKLKAKRDLYKQWGKEYDNQI